jgi:hypothetical protein
MKKRFIITLLCISLISPFVVCPSAVFAGSSISKPSIPEFTLQFVDKSYDVPPTFQKDSFTGETVMTKEGYHVDNRSIEVKIKNPSVTFYTDSHGNRVFLCYDLRWKGHFDDYWYEYSNSRDYTYRDVDYEANSDGSWRANVPYTTVTYVVGTNMGDGKFVYGYNLPLLGDVSEGGQIDFQVQAFIGYYTRVEGSTDPFTHKPEEQLVFTGESSGWSKTKTVTIGASIDGQDQPSSDQNTNSPPDQPNGSSNGIIAGLSLTDCILLVAVTVVLIMLIVITFYYRRRISSDLSKNSLI